MRRTTGYPLRSILFDQAGHRLKTVVLLSRKINMLVEGFHENHGLFFLSLIESGRESWRVIPLSQYDGIDDVNRLGVSERLVVGTTPYEERGRHFRRSRAAREPRASQNHDGPQEHSLRALPRTHQEILRWPAFTWDLRIYTPSRDVNIRSLMSRAADM